MAVEKWVTAGLNLLTGGRGSRASAVHGRSEIHSRAVRLGPGERHSGLPAPVATWAAATRDYAPRRPLQGSCSRRPPSPHCTPRRCGVRSGRLDPPSLFAPGSRPMRHVGASPSTAVMDNYAGRPAARPGNASWSGRRWRGSYAADGIAIALARLGGVADHYRAPGWLALRPGR